MQMTQPAHVCEPRMVDFTLVVDDVRSVIASVKEDSDDAIAQRLMPHIEPRLVHYHDVTGNVLHEYQRRHICSEFDMDELKPLFRSKTKLSGPATFTLSQLCFSNYNPRL
jgi:hypothetical protein